MTNTNIATAWLRGVQIIFALNKQALLNANPNVVPPMVRETPHRGLVSR